MNLPIRFPSDASVAADEAARFRALSPAEQFETLDDMFRLYHLLAANAADPRVVARFAVADEARGRAAIEEFVARHV